MDPRSYYQKKVNDMASDTERRLAEERADLLLKTAKKAKKGVTRRVDGYFDRTYDPGNEARKIGVRGITTSLVVLSLLTGLAFSGPADITQDQSAGSNFTPAPVVLDIDEFVNTPVDEDDDEDGDEQKTVRQSFMARFRQAVLSLPQTVRLLLVVPLWAAGTAIMTVISFLWNILFASPLGAFIASLFMGFAILLGLFTVTAKALFPDVPIRDVTKAQAVVVGPPPMMRFSVMGLLQKGFREENIWVSQERKMCCGLGKCGHCRVGEKYICLDGPVFNYTVSKDMID